MCLLAVWWILSSHPKGCSLVLSSQTFMGTKNREVDPFPQEAEPHKKDKN